ncbi:MAG: TetR/AcrR family transcriptional regulator [Betaproteobacteria bacterium]|nr:TetR/AcrR family transcriptional regulator [Betaproteobacteria bacterium]MDH3437461.1 TetR/AcrR family transcriptional regulator [Betaproteobacteria bacterium]
MDVRTRILDAALRLLAKGGAQELTQPRICKAAGVRQSHLTYYFPTIHDLVLAVALHTLETIAAEVEKHEPAQRPSSFIDAVAGVSSDKRRVRMMLGLVTAADREPRLKPRMRELIKALRQGLVPVLKAAGVEGTPEQVAFMHSVVVGQAVLQLARDDDGARREARKVFGKAVEFLRRKG